jgi:hypothetical protein
MPSVDFEPTIPVFERVKKFQALYLSATVLFYVTIYFLCPVKEEATRLILMGVNLTAVEVPLTSILRKVLRTAVLLMAVKQFAELFMKSILWTALTYKRAAVHLCRSFRSLAI